MDVRVHWKRDYEYGRGSVTTTPFMQALPPRTFDAAHHAATSKVESTTVYLLKNPRRHARYPCENVAKQADDPRLAKSFRLFVNPHRRGPARPHSA